jgi:P27 family predicted phage terminase small subunit
MSRRQDDEDLKDARGTLRSDRDGKGVPFTPLETMRKLPAGLLTRRAKFEYRRVVRVLIEDGLAAEADRSLLVAYCNEIASYHQLARDIAECKEVKISPPKGSEYNCNQALKNAMKLGEMFGLTPAGRSKIKPQKAKQKADPQSTGSQFDELMKAG